MDRVVVVPLASVAYCMLYCFYNLNTKDLKVQYLGSLWVTGSVSGSNLANLGCVWDMERHKWWCAATFQLSGCKVALQTFHRNRVYILN